MWSWRISCAIYQPQPSLSQEDSIRYLQTYQFGPRCKFAEVPLERTTLIHDFIVTEKYFVVVFRRYTSIRYACSLASPFRFGML